MGTQCVPRILMKIWIFNHYADDANAPDRQATSVHEFHVQLI